MLNFPFRQTFYFTLKCNIAVQNIVKKARGIIFSFERNLVKNTVITESRYQTKAVSKPLEALAWCIQCVYNKLIAAKFSLRYFTQKLSRDTD